MAERKFEPLDRENYYKQRPSFIVNLFLQWLVDMRDQSEEAWNIVTSEDDKLQDYIHEMEFETSSKKRSPIGTRLHNSRVKRRIAKDKSTILKPIHDFAQDSTNRGFIKRMKKLQADLKAAEDYVYGERAYKPRAKEYNDGNNN